MLAIHRIATQRIKRLTSRSFAEVVGVSPGSSTPLTSLRPPQRKTTKPHPLKKRIPVKEDHGLYAFFRRKEDSPLAGEAKYDVVESPESMAKQTGRAWKASELRLKSFRDLHTLWYILLRERSLLATQKEEARRMGVPSPSKQVSLRRVYHCRKSMARIKAVLNERRLAYEGAIKIVEAEKEEKIDAKVQKYLTKTWKKERAYLQRRREYKARRLGKSKATKEGSRPAEGADPQSAEKSEELVQHSIPSLIS